MSRPATAATTITQGLVGSGKKDYEKRETLRRLINEADELNNAIIFCNRKTEVANLYRSLVRHEYSVAALHGDMDQRARMQALAAFRDGKIKLLVASDVAARGLDIPEVSHVFNFDVPFHAEDYVHRIGRTGRAGRKGTAYTIVTRADTKAVSAIEALTGQPINWVNPIPESTGADETDERSNARGGRVRRGGTKEPSRGEESPRRERGEDAPRRARNSERTGEETPKREPRKAPAVAAETPARTPARPPLDNEQRRPRRPDPTPRHRDDDDGDTVGHLPSFLLRPVRKAQA